MSAATDTIPVGAKTQLIAMNERGIVLRTFEDAYRFGLAVVASGLAPRHFDTPEKVVIAVQWGAEIGLSKMQSLQSIAVINERPCVWGDALPALVWSSGKCADIVERFEGPEESNDFRAVCEVHRIGKASPTTATFSISDAKAAKLWGKVGRNGNPTPWVTYPKRMLKIRARAFAFRDTFPDVLCGMAVAEEVQDTPIDRTESLPRIENGPVAMLAATLDGIGCTAEADKVSVCRYVLRDSKEDHTGLEWSGLTNELAREVMARVTAIGTPWKDVFANATH